MTIKLKRAKSVAKEILKELEQTASIDGHIGLVMERASETAFLSPLEQLIYKSIRSDIQDLCNAHNRLWDSSNDKVNPSTSIVNACAVLEQQVNDLNDRMNDFLKDCFDNVTKQTLKKKNLNKRLFKSELKDELNFIYEKNNKKVA